MTPSVARQLLLMVSGKNHVKKSNNFNLSNREKDILELLVKGFSYKMIAEKCSISYATVNSHISHIYEKLHVSSGTEAVAKAIEHQIVGQ
jgi:DNA-binding NarL/FixJ family response regulator